MGPALFLPAGVVWDRMRKGEVNPTQVGLDRERGPHGRSFIVSGILHDLSALALWEPLCSDSWGLDSKPRLSDSDLQVLDLAASMSSRNDVTVSDIDRLLRASSGLSRIRRR